MEAKQQFSKKITGNSEKFTASDKKIVDFLLSDYPHCLLKNATEVAGNVGVNVSTVTRFFKKIGYKNIREARLEFREDADFIISSPMDRIKKEGSLTPNCFAELVDVEVNNIRSTIINVNEEQILKIVQLLAPSTPQIFVVSARSKPFALAYYFYVQVELIRSGVKMLDTDKQMIAHELSSASESDLMVVFHMRRYSKTNIKIVETFRKIGGGTVVAFTDSPVSPLGRIADISFVIDTKSPSLFDSYTAGFSLINLIIAKLADSLPVEISEKYQKIEQIYRNLDIYFQK
jgi:DNA-binding MurR/RpiR family transcriptional regulator